MPEKIETKLKVTKLQAAVKVVEDDSGRRLVTDVKFDYEGTPARLDDIFQAMKNGHPVDIVISSPQTKMEGT
jgi:hypothetical protein